VVVLLALGAFLRGVGATANRSNAAQHAERDEAEKIAKRAFKPTSVERAWDHFVAKYAD
jgi:hypothetical protein